MATAPRVIVAFRTAKSVSKHLANCRMVVDMMTNNPAFPTPTPPLTQVSAHLTDLENDEKEANKGGKAAAPQRDVSLAVVNKDMRMLRAYVQNIADALPAPEAAVVVLSSGMKVGKKAARSKPPVQVRLGKLPGQVLLIAKALLGKVSYRWQRSTDGETWTDAADTFHTTAVVEGLTRATVHYFRMRTMTTAGLSAWSPVISIVVT